MYYSSWVMCSFQKGFLEAIKAWWQEISGLIVAWSGGKYPDTTWAFRVSICLFLMMAFWEDLPGPKLPHCLATCSIPHSSLIKWKKKSTILFLAFGMCLLWAQEENSLDHKCCLHLDKIWQCSVPGRHHSKHLCMPSHFILTSNLRK